MKEELAAQKALSQQTRTLQKKIKDRETQVGDLELQVDELSSELSSAQNEIKTLQTKLAAARNTVANVESVAAKVPGSAVKNTGSNRTIMAANAEAIQAAQIAQLKEDLYSDLTGLIIRDVKKRETDDIYDCIQTGANGSKFINFSRHQLLLMTSQLFILSWLLPMNRKARPPAVSNPPSFTISRCSMIIATRTW